MWAIVLLWRVSKLTKTKNEMEKVYKAFCFSLFIQCTVQNNLYPKCKENLLKQGHSVNKN